MTKADLHVHLSGLVETSVVMDMLIAAGILRGSELSPEHLKVLNPVGCLTRYLEPWRYLKAIRLTKENVVKMTTSAFNALIRDNIKKVEVRHTVMNIAKDNILSLEEAIIFLCDVIESEGISNGIDAGLVITISRGPYAYNDGKRFIQALRNIGRASRVIGLDLAGDENIDIDPRIANVFLEAKYELGLGITIHAGETGNLLNVYTAIEKYHADRIGHGTAAVKSNKILKLIRDKNVCIEVCPTSNTLSGAFDGHTYHPVKVFYDHDIPFVICSDNPEVHSKTLSDDYLIALQEIKDLRFLGKQYELQSKYSFLRRRCFDGNKILNKQ